MSTTDDPLYPELRRPVLVPRLIEQGLHIPPQQAMVEPVDVLEALDDKQRRAVTRYLAGYMGLSKRSRALTNLHAAVLIACEAGLTAEFITETVERELRVNEATA